MYQIRIDNQLVTISKKMVKVGKKAYPKFRVTINSDQKTICRNTFDIIGALKSLDETAAELIARRVL